MAIPEAQLEAWSHQGAIAGSSATYQTAKKVLESSTAPYTGKGYKVFLQGSYGNDTNIYSESDVDVVIRLDETFASDLTLLSEPQKTSWEAAFPNATYTHADFRRDVLGVLNAAFPNAVTAGDKAFTIKAEGNRRKADVLPAISYRRYYKFNGIFGESFEPGICFWNREWTRIANYPDQHCSNLTKKHQSSGLRLKPNIRVLKNLRNKLVNAGLIKAETAPSYYLEGLLYNVPDDKFSSCYGDTFVNAINWVQQQADKSKLITANEQYYLLRDGYKTCWPIADGEAFLNAAINLWNNW
jgi:hypothetical protein